MRLSRMLFGLPFACMALAAALMFFSAPSSRFDYDISAVSWQLPEFTVFDVMLPADAILVERSLLDKPADAHQIVYVVANQPLATWRIAADSAYSHIDPHIAAS